MVDSSVFPLYLIEILHQTTTFCRATYSYWRCILLKFYIKPQLRIAYGTAANCCILLKFYIKPQLGGMCTITKKVVSYWNSTSNHNFAWSENSLVVLYLIEILHQTTTCSTMAYGPMRLYLIEILHQTTTQPLASSTTSRCILLKFYIKPQLRISTSFPFAVVSYWNSTSNHNVTDVGNRCHELYLIEILHQTTTLPF